MELLEYRNLYQLEDTYWWFVARRRLVEELLARACGRSPQRLLVDIGCGTGANALALAAFGNVVLLDLSAEALRFCRLRGLRTAVACSAESIGLASNSIDIVTALDVLEHVDHDIAAMREACRILKPGGTLLVTVPAFGFLWSEHDEALHHRRRYTHWELRNKLTVAGFDVGRSTYFITLLFFPIFLLRFWQGIFKKDPYPKSSLVLLPKSINRLLERLLAVERWLCRWVNLPFGVSIVAVARKPVPSV